MRIIHQNAFQSRDQKFWWTLEVPGSDVNFGLAEDILCTSQVVMMNLDMVGAYFFAQQKMVLSTRWLFNLPSE